MDSEVIETANPAQPILPQDSATTQAEKIVRNGLTAPNGDDFEHDQLSPNKRVKLENKENEPTIARERLKGIAQIKLEYLLDRPGNRATDRRGGVEADDDAEASGDRYASREDRRNRNGKDDKKKKFKGQNTSRNFGTSRDALQLCNSRVQSPEFSPKDCSFGDKCKLEHDLRKYLKEGKREDLKTFDGICPVWDARGACNLGWKCRFVGSHSEERDTEDGRKELILIEDPDRKPEAEQLPSAGNEVGVVNVVSREDKINLSKRKTETPKSDAYLQWLHDEIEQKKSLEKQRSDEGPESDDLRPKSDQVQENRAQYVEPPFLVSEKRRLYYGPETPVLAPLTTQGNLPFRRLCVELGAQVTWSEMAMGLPLIQGEKSEWALMKAHESETSPPKFQAKPPVVQSYDNSRDLKFGAQIAANKPWLATKTVEVLTMLCPSLRAIDLNCGCPIDLVCNGGSGSALLDNHAKLENILRGMNAVSNETPITVKIRMGTRDSQPTAEKLIKRLILGGHEAIETGKGTAGVAAITLHGRSKQQRYTKSANWEYISDCAALISRLKRSRSEQSDTAADPDPRNLANNGNIYFIGNGDCYSHVDYYKHLEEARVDSVMVARGALIKPWIFEEIEKRQYLDKSASERLGYVEKFAKYGLQTWGSDELGVGTTRKFLLEWLSFAHRYVPLGILEHLPPHIQDRPPAYKGRNDLETLMSSDNYRDWIKISEMFLGPAHPNFKFEPKHKSNSYEIEAEG